jgi:hypothetical protein
VDNSTGFLLTAYGVLEPAEPLIDIKYFLIASGDEFKCETAFAFHD